MAESSSNFPGILSVEDVYLSKSDSTSCVFHFLTSILNMINCIKYMIGISRKPPAYQTEVYNFWSALTVI